MTKRSFPTELSAALFIAGGIPLLVFDVLCVRLEPLWAVEVGAALLLLALALSIGYLLSLRIEKRVRERQDELSHQQRRHLRERETFFQTESVKHALSQFLPPTLATEIASGQKPLELNGRRRPVSVVCVEFLELTGSAECKPPTHVIGLLRQLSSIISELVFRQGGIINWATGGSLVAVFGAIEFQGDHTQRALAAAEDIRRFVEATSLIRQQAFSFDVQIAIGVSTGDAIVGNVGSEGRLEYTAIGEVVGIAARLAALARPGQILTTDEVASQTSGAAGFELHSVGERLLFGRHTPARLLELA